MENNSEFRIPNSKLAMRTPSLADENFAALAKLFPNAVTETIVGYEPVLDAQGNPVKDHDGVPKERPIIERAIDADVLAQEINTHVVKGREERYQFTWPDKRKSILLANAPIAAALRPCREESVDFDTTENLYIEGDNLDVLKLLRETYLNRVKMIYIAPPYNTGHDFVYEDDFAEDAGDFLRRDGQYDEQGNRLTPNLDSNGRFHTDWLNMIYPRLRVSKDLLASDGVIFISIDENEVHNLRKICDEVFGASCFVCEAVWRHSDNSNNDAKQFSSDHNTTLVYSKQPLWHPQKVQDQSKRTHFKNPDNDPRGAWFDGNPLNSPNYRENLIYDLVSPNGNVIKPPKNGWRWSKETMQAKIASGEIRFTPDETNIRRRTYLSDMGGLPPSDLWIDLEKTGHTRQAKYELMNLMDGDYFNTPKPVKLILYILSLMNCANGDIILDFFSGSATTAHAVMQLNAEDGGKRKFIMVQLPEVTDEKSEAAKAGYKNICEIGKERIRRAGAKIKADSPLTTGDLDVGFRVLKIDSSNMKDVYYTPDEYTMVGFDLEGLADNIKPDRTPEDLLFQVMLDLGIPLSAKIRREGDVFYVNDNYLVACFARVDTDMITEIAKLEPKPYYAVFRDSSFASDSAMVNFDQIFNTYSPNTIRRVL